MTKDVTTKQCYPFKITLEEKFKYFMSQNFPVEIAIKHTIDFVYTSKEFDPMCQIYLIDYFINDLGDSYLNDEIISKVSDQYTDYENSLISSDLAKADIMKAYNISWSTLDEFADKMHNSSIRQKLDGTNINYNLNHIWLTQVSKPREMFNSDIKTVIYNKEFFTNSDQHWSHVVWTNDKALIPLSVKTLESNGIEVRSIYHYKEKIQLFDDIIDLIEKGKFGMASDILRCSILFQWGGAYSDVNFKFYQQIDQYMQKYDFLTKDFQNNFFASPPNHIILEKTIEKVKENLETPPDYLQNSSTDITISATYMPFLLSFVKYANLEGHVDFYADYYYAYDMPDLYPGPLGEDNIGTSNTWRDEL
jgi:hypothetical protein